MKKGDKYRGLETGLCLEIQDIKKDVVSFSVERRNIDRATGEVKIVVNERQAPTRMMPSVLRGYEKA